MSGNANGYVFPPPLLAHPPFEARNLFRNSMVRGGREVENFGNYGGSYHDPNFNVENQSWSPYPESSFPKPRYHPQCNQRMQGMLPPSRKHAFPIGTSHCKRLRRPPIRVGSRPTDQSPQNGWNTSDVAKTNGEQHYCEPCDKEFKSENDKKAHFKQHVKCEVESCNFVASRKAIKLHYIQNHEVGKFKIVLKNDEDIEKWREDRRKNYPSAAMKSEKITMEEVRKCHGNVLKKRSFSYKGNGKWKRGNFSQSQRCVLQKTDNNIENRMINGEKADVKNLDHSCKENETIELSMSCLEEKPEVVARNGLETLKQLYDSSENDDSSDDENDSIEESADTVLCSSFSTFASKENKKEQLNLNTSCNFPKEIDDTVEIKHNDAKVIRHRGGAEVCMGGFLDSNREKLQVESGIESCMVKKTPIEHKTKLLDGRPMEGINENKTLGSNRKKKWIDKDDRKNRNHGRICQRHRPTLLEMLLAKDIKHERNIILQCIRFVKERNFFIMDLK